MSEKNLPSILSSDAQLPAHLRDCGAAVDEADSLVTGIPTLPKLSIQSKQFRYTVDKVETILPLGDTLKVVILAADPAQGMCKAYYENAWVPGTDTPPDCASADGIKPDSDVSSPKSDVCDGCEFNAWGSGKDQSGNFTKGKACSDSKILCLVHADHVNGAMSALRVPATSLKALSVFGKTLKRQKVPMQSVTTELSFADAAHPQLKFTAVGYLPEADFKICMERKDSAELLDALPSTYSQSAATETVVAIADDSAKKLPPPPPAKVVEYTEPEYVVTELAETSLEEYIKAGWPIQTMLDANIITIKGEK